MKRSLWMLTLVLIGMLVLPPVMTARAQASDEYRVYRMNGTYVEGRVREMPDGSLEITTKQGAVVTLKKNQVLKKVALSDLVQPGDTPKANGPGSKRPALRRQILQTEIDEILSGIKAEITGVGVATGRDLMAPLPVNEDSVKEMLQQVGLKRDSEPIEKQKNVLLKDHFVMVYTSSDQAAKELAARVESVYRWNVRFMDMLKIPARRPEYKLELFYFGDYKDYEAFSINTHGMDTAGGAILGYYMPKTNRSHFFDLMTASYVKRLMDRLKQKDIPFQLRRYITNKVSRWVEFMNQSVIQHETGHHIHFNMGVFPRDGLEREGSVPIWLVEGTTQMFEFPPSKAGTSLGVQNDYRLFQLREIYGTNPIPYAYLKLFIIDNHEWRGGMSYPLGWALVYYLWKEQRKGYSQYLQKVFGREEGVKMSNTDREKEFEDIFGRVDEKWVEKFQKWLNSLVVRKSLLPPLEGGD